MVEPQTVSQTLARLEKEGYTEDFKATTSGLQASPKNVVIAPENLNVDKIYRFEGETNVDDEEIIFALSCPQHNIKGIFLVAFGPKMDPLDEDMVHRLQKSHRQIDTMNLKVLSGNKTTWHFLIFDNGHYGILA
jgi:hypothetical protein